jgi:HEAT repeat protein
MKKILHLLIALLVGWSSLVSAQGPSDQRAFHTKVADVLALMPAPNKTQFNANMEAIAALGEEGLTTIAGMLAAPGKGDNTQLQYAIAGYAYYVTQPGKEAARKQAVTALCKALPKAGDPENKVFLLTQLQTVGDDAAVSTLQGCLTNDRLCDPAARALVKINTPAAQQALLQALPSTTGFNRITLTEALGDSRYTAAAAAIAPLANDADKRLAKVALYALAQIGAPASAPVLAAAAAKSGYAYDVTDATSSYLYYAANLTDKAAAEKIADNILKTAKTDGQVHTRTAALKLLTTIRGEKSMPLLLAAADDKNREYRDAALKFAGQNGLAGNALWLKKLAGADNANKAAVVGMLGDNKVAAALPAIQKLLGSKDETVKLAAIKAAGQTGGAAALPALLQTMKTGDAATVEAVKNALLIMPGDEVAAHSGAALATMPAAAQTALLTVLAARKADSRVNDVLPLTGSTDATTRSAAISALKDVATKGNLPALFTLLNNSSDATDISNLQAALISAGANSADVLTQMKQVSADKQSRYLPVLAGIGETAALAPVVSAFNNGDATTKKAALLALSSWKSAVAAPALLQIAREKANNDYREEALAGYVGLTRRSTFPAEQQLLMLRNAMELSTTPTVQKKILEGAERCKILPALLFAGNYLDNAPVQQAAANAVMNIALADKSFNGATVRALLEKTAQVLKGQDADYQRQSISKYLAEMPAGDGFVAIFNGKDLSGWKGLVENPIARGKMDAKNLAKAQQKADDNMRKGWSVKDGLLVFGGSGDNLCTEKKYGDFEMLVDWKITAQGDAGIYLRGSPQVQIWDTSRTDVGAQVGSGGLYNNQKHESKPLKLADNAIGEWNHFRILMKGDRVTVYLNGELVTDNTILENYWDRGLPIFPDEQIELQAHGTYVAYRDLYVKEIPRPKPYVLSDEEKKAGYKLLFDGTNMHEWVGNTKDYVIDNGDLIIDPSNGGHGNLYTKDEYKNFSFRFEFQLTPGANNGLGVRAPLEGDAAYVGMELQILDNEADVYKSLHEYQYHGSVYGVIAAKRGFLKPVGEWNVEEAIVDGTHIKVVLNGTVILDGDIADARKNGTLDHKDHPGLKNETGHIGFLGHGSTVRFRYMRVKTL